MKDKKWKLAIWGMGIGTFLILVGAIGWLAKIEEGYIAIIGEGAGLLTLVISAYITGNVIQKKNTSQYYQPILDENNDSSESFIYGSGSETLK